MRELCDVCGQSLADQARRGNGRVRRDLGVLGGSRWSPSWAVLEFHPQTTPQKVDFWYAARINSATADPVLVWVLTIARQRSGMASTTASRSITDSRMILRCDLERLIGGDRTARH